MGDRVCQQCGVSIDGRHWRAKFCHQKCKDRFRRIAYPEKVKAWRAKWGKTEKARETRLKWYAESKESRREYGRAWYAKHAPRLREVAAAYREKLGDEYRINRSNRRWDCRDKINRQSRAWERKSSASRHAQACINAIPAIMALLEASEKQDDQ